jgi:hypothetical protein
MSAVPYTFANNTGNIPLSELDANFANVKAFANTAGYVTANAQANITSVGTLTTLSVSGNITGNYIIGNITGNINSSNVTGSNITGGNITSGNIVVTTSITSPTVITNFISSDDSTVVIVEDGLEIHGGIVADSFTVNDGTFTLPSLTDAQIANIVAANGAMVYNSTQSKIQGYEGGAWGNLI